MRKRATTSIGCWCAMLLGVSASGTLAVDPTQGTQPSRPATAPAASPLDRVNAIGWTPLTIAGGVYYPNLYEEYPDAEAMLKKLGASNPGTRRPIDSQPQREGAPVRKL